MAVVFVLLRAIGLYHENAIAIEVRLDTQTVVICTTA